MSACRFFRNFLPSPQMIPKDNSSHQTREKEHQNHGLKMQKTQGARFPSPNVERTKEFQFPNHKYDRRCKKVSEVSPKTDLNQTMAQGNLNLQVIGTSSSESTGRNVCGTEENSREKVDTITSNRPSGSSRISKEMKNDSTAEYEQSCSPNTKTRSNVVSPVKCASLQAVPVQTKHAKAEEDVMATTESCDKLFQDIVNLANSSSKTSEVEESRGSHRNIEQEEQLDVSLVGRDGVNVRISAESQSEKANNASIQIGPEPVTISDDECCSIVSSANTEIYEDTDCQAVELEEEKALEDIGKHDEGILEAIIRKYVLNLAASADVRFQFPSEMKSNEAQKKTNEEHVLSMNDRIAHVYQSLGSSDLNETSNRPFQLEECQIPEILNVITESSRSATTNSYSVLRGILNSTLQSDDLCDNVLSKGTVAITDESRISNTTSAKSNEIESEDNWSSVEKKDGRSAADGIGYKDEVLSNGVSPSSTVIQALLPSNQSYEAREVPSLLSPDIISYSGTSSSIGNNMTKFVFSKLPPGANLIDARGIFLTPDKSKPFACGYCGKADTRRDFVNRHIIQQHDEIPRFACECCGKRFGDQYHLSQHLRHHSQEMPFFCHHCGMRFRVESDLCNHELEHPKVRPFYCDFCNKSFKTKSDFLYHKKFHEKVELRKSFICNVCKQVFRLRSALTQHMISHEKPLESGINDTTKTIPKNMYNNDRLSKNVIGKRVSIAAGVVYNDEVSAEGSQSPTMTQTLLSSDHSDVAKDVSVSCSRQENTDRGASSTFCSKKDSKKTLQFPPGSTLVGHRGVYRMKDKEKPFGCGYCDKTYRTRLAAYSHIRQRHEKKRVQHSCEICGKHFSVSSYLAQHMRIHTQEKPFTCDECGKQFCFNSSLHSHKRTHSNEKPYACNECNKSFKFSDHLSRHAESHKNEDQRKGVSCSVCKRKLGKPSLLKQHMMIHTGEKPFKCTSCDKQFRLKVQLRNHMDSHLGKKKLAKDPCSICGKILWATHMPDHMRMHAGVKPFECSICGKRFPKKANLEGHIRSHTGEKPFACDRCNKRFALYSNMVTHKAKCSTLSTNIG